jgi:hypothetical protein
MYGPEMFAFFVLCVVLFIGEVFYNEAFSDCSSPGALTWTITMNPGSEASMCAGGSASSGGSKSSGASSGASGSSGTSSGASGSGSTSSGKSTTSSPLNVKKNDDNYYGHNHDIHHTLGEDDDYYGYSAQSIERLWRDISGSDVSGNRLNNDYNFNLSLSDLLSLVGKTIVYGDSRPYNLESQQYSLDSRPYNLESQQYSLDSRYQRRSNNRRNPPQDPYYNEHEEYYDNTNSPSNAQAVDYIQLKNRINMDDYVRKDSIPCYGCTLP